MWFERADNADNSSWKSSITARIRRNCHWRGRNIEEGSEPRRQRPSEIRVIANIARPVKNKPATTMTNTSRRARTKDFRETLETPLPAVQRNADVHNLFRSSRKRLQRPRASTRHDRYASPRDAERTDASRETGRSCVSASMIHSQD